MIKTNFLDESYALLLQGDGHNGMDKIFKGLKACRDVIPAEEWRNFVISEVLTHPVKELAHLCPFTNHSFYKPRGYAGDAGLIDFIYGEGTAKQHQLEGIASAIAQYTLNAPAARAVRYRRELLAKRIDDATANEKNPWVLSIAAGHLREIELSQAALSGQIGRFHALDHKESVQLMQRKYGSYNISASVGSVRQLLSGKFKFNGLYLVYAAGLFDYLPDKVAQRLIEVMFSFLKPGGRMLVANFLPNLPDVGYMEIYMDWFLIFRSAEDMAALFETLPQNEVDSLVVSFDPDENIVFVEATKK